MEAVIERVRTNTRRKKKTEVDKMLDNIRRIVTRHKTETITEEHFINKGFVIK